MSKLTTLLRDYGYRYENGTLLDKGIPGLFPARVIGKFSSELSACDRLCSIIKEDEFTTRLLEAQTGGL